MSLYFLRPRAVGGYSIDYHSCPPEVGGIEVIIWRSARRDDGFMIHCRDWGHVYRLLSDIGAIVEGRG